MQSSPARREGAGSEGRWRAYTYDEIAARDKVSLDIFWLRDDTLEDPNNLPAPDVLAQKSWQTWRRRWSSFGR